MMYSLVIYDTDTFTPMIHSFLSQQEATTYMNKSLESKMEQEGIKYADDFGAIYNIEIADNNRIHLVNKTNGIITHYEIVETKTT